MFTKSIITKTITIDCRHPEGDDVYEKCVNAWYDAGFIGFDSYDQITTLTNSENEKVEISYGFVKGYTPSK